MQLDISAGERDLLVKVLNNYRATLRDEIYRTEAATFKRELKEEEELLDRILSKLGQQKPSGVTAA
jgi:hypothetical protein